MSLYPNYFLNLHHRREHVDTQVKEPPAKMTEAGGRSALRTLDKALALEPEFVEAYYNRGNAYESEGQLVIEAEILPVPDGAPRPILPSSFIRARSSLSAGRFDVRRYTRGSIPANAQARRCE